MFAIYLKFGLKDNQLNILLAVQENSQSTIITLHIHKYYVNELAEDDAIRCNLK